MSAPDVVHKKTTDRRTERCFVKKLDDIDDISRNVPDIWGKCAAKLSIEAIEVIRAYIPSRRLA